MSARVYRVPPKFYGDHRTRDCGQTGIILKETSKFVEVVLDDTALADLRGDADYYVHEGVGSNGMEREFLGLVSSAAATLRALDKGGRPATATELATTNEASPTIDMDHLDTVSGMNAAISAATKVARAAGLSEAAVQRVRAEARVTYLASVGVSA